MLWKPSLRPIALALQTSVLLTVCLAGAEGQADEAVAASRPVQWAVPIGDMPGLPNLFRVDAGLYRAAQPSTDGFATLSRGQALASGDQPIRTVLSLRALDDDGPILPPRSTLHLEQIRFFTWHAEDEDVVEFLRIVTTPAMQPVLVHCQHGADRTGMMIAVYRIIVQGWSKQQALDEMVYGGYGFHPIWQNLRRYVAKLDVAAIKAELAKEGPWQPTIPAFTISLSLRQPMRADR